MKINKWTLGLAAAGLVSLGSVAQAEENQVMTALSSTSISGYVSTSAIIDFDSGPNVTAGRTYVTGPKMDGFNLDVVKISLEKPIDEGSWSAGYKVGLYLGPDADVFASEPGADNFGIPEAYVDLRAPVGNGITFRMGYFPTILGYEVFDNPSNPNFSRSFGYAMEPFNHTGILAMYQVNEIIGFSAGIANDGIETNFINAKQPNNSTLSYMAAVNLTAPEGTGALEGATLTAGVLDTGLALGPDPLSFYVGGSLPTPIEGLSVGIAWDYVSDYVGGGGDDQWALAGYVAYQATDKLALYGRVDYAEADDSTPGVLLTGSEDLLSFTATLDYSLWDNVLSRLEFRYDNADAKVLNGGEDDAASLAANLVYQF